MLDSWWSQNYPYRRHLSVLGFGGANKPANADVMFSDFYSKGKVRTDRADVVVAHYNGSTWTPLGSYIAADTIEFPLVSNIDFNVIENNYYIYYGNLSLVDPPSLSYAQNSWPDTAHIVDLEVSYTRPGEHWEDGISSTRDARATFVFYGQQIRLICDTGPSYGVMLVQVDDGSWNSVDLYSSSILSDQIVFTATNLLAGDHFIRLRVAGARNPLSVSNKINFKRFEYKNFISVSDLGEEVKTLSWGTSFGGGIQ